MFSSKLDDEDKEALPKVTLLFGQWFASTSTYFMEPVYIGIWDKEDLDGSISMVSELIRLKIYRKKFCIYILLKA